MSRKLLVAFIAILAVVSFVGTASALHTITDEVISVNPPWQELTINISGFPVTFTAIDRATMDLAAVQPGDMVRVATDSFLSDFSPVNHHESGDWKAMAESITKLFAGS